MVVVVYRGEAAGYAANVDRPPFPERGALSTDIGSAAIAISIAELIYWLLLCMSSCADFSINDLQ
jgi:hypothetical protein